MQKNRLCVLRYKDGNFFREVCASYSVGQRMYINDGPSREYHSELVCINIGVDESGPRIAYVLAEELADIQRILQTLPVNQIP